MSSSNDKPLSKEAAEKEAEHERALAGWARMQRGDFADAITRRRARGVATDPKVREAMDALEDEAREREMRAHDLESSADAYERERSRLRYEEERQAARDIELAAWKLEEARDQALHNATERLFASGDGSMSPESWQAFRKQLGSAISFDEGAGKLAIIAKRHSNVAGAYVKNEPGPYGPGSPNSWFRDMAAAFTPTDSPFAGQSVQEAHERLNRHAQDVTSEIRRGSDYGKRAKDSLLEHTRTNDVPNNKKARERRSRELRALTTGGGATAAAVSGGAAFVSPAFVDDAFAPFKGIHRTFADQCGTGEMPEFGMEVYLPYFASATSVTQQTEGQPVSESDPTAALQSAQVQTVSGQVTISQQLHDRGVTGGGSFDVVLGKQLMQQLDQSVETYALTQALSTASPVAGQATFSIAGLYQDIAKGREALTDTAGTRLRPTHFFSTSDFYSYVTRQVDTTQRPIVVPTFTPGFPLAEGDEQSKWSRFTGTVLPGGVLWFEADAIPTYGTTNETQLIVSAPDEALVLFEGPPMLVLYPQTDSLNLEIVVNLRKYVAAVTRFQSGTASITSLAYTSNLV